VGTNDNNRQFGESGASNQDNTSRRLGIPIDNVSARPLNDITVPSILPKSGSLRTVPTDHFVSTPRGNRAAK
jgi:hypothetical protein